MIVHPSTKLPPIQFLYRHLGVAPILEAVVCGSGGLQLRIEALGSRV